MPQPEKDPSPILLEALGIKKSFPGVIALDNVSFSLKRGEVHGLVGKNGAGIIATHDLDLAMDVCQRTIILHDGKITADDSTKEIFKNDRLLEESGLARPLRMQGCPVCKG